MKKTFLLDIEKQISSQWDNNEREYHKSRVEQSKPKFFATFPYPYMNGKLHLGHAFTLTKVDFTCRFKRLSGHNVLFPFGFHCTGMPICAAAKKLENELATIPNIQLIQTDQTNQTDQTDQTDQTNTNKSGSLQYNILKYYNLTHDEIVKFTNPLKWVKYFSQEGLTDVKSFGLMVDLSRSFVTTNLNPFYDSFVSYQFEKLHQAGLLKYGTRNSIYSSNLNIQCQDHDRSVGEGVGIEEYHIKLLKSNTNPNHVFIFVVRKSSAEAPEYNILLNCKSQFVKFNLNGVECYCSKYIYKNIQEQNIFEFDDLDQYKNICEDITNPEILLGVFESVKLVDNIALSETIKTTSFNTVKMIELVGFAIKPINQTNLTNLINLINSINSTELTESIEKLTKLISTSPIYLTDDIVIDRTGVECVVKPLPQWYINYADQEWKDKTIQLVKTHMDSSAEITKTLISNITKLHEWGVSRQFGLGTRLPCDSNELIDSLSDSTIYPAYYTISNMIQSNIFGIALNNIDPIDFTFEVWDYIFSNRDTEPNLSLNSSIDIELLNKMRESFDYWYPVDLRISGKDLLSNHLVMYLFNHTACFKEKYFPKKIFANGWILVDGVKMAKSNGNFITVGELIDVIPIDSIRMTLADSGDDLADANFVRANASDNNLLKIYDWVKHMEELNSNDLKKRCRYDSKTIEFIDELFIKLIDKQIQLVIKYYNELRFRDVLIEGFFNLNGLREKYKIYCGILGLELHDSLINAFCITQTILLNPIIPHSTEYVWTKVFGHNELIYNSPFVPIIMNNWTKNLTDLKNGINNSVLTNSYEMINDWENLMDLIKQVQSTLTKNLKKKNWTCKKIILKYNLKVISKDFVQNLFSQVLKYQVAIVELDRSKPYFNFEIN